MMKFKLLSIILCVCLLASSLSVFVNTIDIPVDVSDLFGPGNSGNDSSSNNNNDNQTENTPGDDVSTDPSNVEITIVNKTDGNKNNDDKKEDKKEEVIVYNSTFSDVTEDKWFYQYVTTLASKGIVNGYDDGSFKPQNNVTRAEFIKLLVECMGYNQVASNSFEDIAKKDWFYVYVSTALENGVINKDDYGTNLNPNGIITRKEAARLLVKAAQLETGKYQTPYCDSEDEFVVALYTICLMQGEIDASSGDRYFKPDSGITRAETSTVFSRLLEYNENPEKFVTEKMAEYNISPLKVLMTDANSFNNEIYGIGVSPMSFYLYSLDKNTDHNQFSNSFLTSYEAAFSHLPEYFTFTDLVIDKVQTGDSTDVTVRLESESCDFSMQDLYDMTLLSFIRGKEITESIFSFHEAALLSDIDKLKIIYTYITQNVTYPTHDNPDDMNYLAMSVFANNTGTCQAIASAFNILCRSANLDSCAISFNNHVFNCVLIDGEYLFFDPTYEITSRKYSDSPIPDKSMNYFALTHEKMQNIHGNFPLPIAFWCTLE